MNFFKKIFGYSDSKPRHPLNAPGDFYVEANACILCGAPEVVASGLMGHSDDGCYFIKQPQTEEEIEYALNAIAVSCVSAVRYGGTDKKIIKRLYDMGCAKETDHGLC